MSPKLLRAACLTALGVAALAIPSGFLLDRFAGQDVVLVLPFGADAIEINRATFEPGEAVAAIYGTPVGGDVGRPGSTAKPPTTRVLFARADRVLRPVEDPSLTLLKVDKQAGDNPLQAVTVAYLAKMTAAGAAIVGVLLLLWWRRAARPPVSA